MDTTLLIQKVIGIDFYGDHFFTTEKEIETHPERVEKMIHATLKGWQYALDNQDEIIDLIIKKYAPKLNRVIKKGDVYDFMLFLKISTSCR